MPAPAVPGIAMPTKAKKLLLEKPLFVHESIGKNGDSYGFAFGIERVPGQSRHGSLLYSQSQ